jgi:proton glutamate symport protein
MSNATRILLALFLGLILGIASSDFNPDTAKTLADIADPIGTLWLNGLRMTIVPLVVALLVTGIVQTAEAARAGRMAARTLIWIVGLMSFSAVMGAILTPTFLALFPMPVESASALKAALTTAPAVGAVPPFGDIVKALVPTNPIAAAANNDILPLMIFTLALAFAITRLASAPRKSLADVFAALADALVIVIEWVLKLAPIGVFALAYVVGARSGVAAFGALLHYVAVVSAVGIVLGLCAYPVARFAGRIPLGRFIRGIAPVQALAISTQSSLACLPLMLKKSEDLGASEATAGLVLPMSVALMRVTGPAMNLAVALYVANWFGVTLGPVQWAIAIVIAVLTSMGAVSLPGQVSFFTSCAPICIAIGAPLEPLALLVAVETLPDIFRTLGNVQMDVAVTTAVEAQSRAKDAASPQIENATN